MAVTTTGAWSSSPPDRKSTRLNSSHVAISYAVFCLKKKIKQREVPIWCKKQIHDLVVRDRGAGFDAGDAHAGAVARIAPDRVFFFNDTATTEIYTLSLHDALPI